MGGQGSGKPKKPKIKKLIKELLPKDKLFEEHESKMYDDLLNAYLSDFDQEELISSDLDDIMNLAMNKVLAYRLLETSKGSPDKQIDIAQTLERLDKRNEKIKESLSTRRRDRINPNELKGFSIVDLAVAYDLDVQAGHMKKMKKLRQEEAEVIKSRENYEGNKNDILEVNKEDKKQN